MGLDSGGNVVSLALKPGPAKEALREMLEKAIRSWKFKPAEIDGRPAATDTYLVVTLSFAPSSNDSGYSITFEQVSTGPAIRKYGRQPQFSESRWKAAVHAKLPRQRVSVKAIFDEKGDVQDVVLADDSQTRRGPMVNEVLSAVRSWKFSPERVDGKGIRAYTFIQFCFDISRDPNAAPCTPEFDIASDSSRDQPDPAKRDGRPGAQSRVTLLSEVVGTTL